MIPCNINNLVMYILFDCRGKICREFTFNVSVSGFVCERSGEETKVSGVLLARAYGLVCLYL